MLTIVIEVDGDDTERLGATLASLVPASVEGLVREVVILDRGMGASTRRLAEHAGCRLRPANELGDAVAAARGDWLLLLEAGSEPMPGWIDAVFRHLRGGSEVERGARFRPSERRFSEIFSLGRASRLSRGVLAPRTLLGRRYRIGMRLRDLASAVPTVAFSARIRMARRD